VTVERSGDGAHSAEAALIAARRSKTERVRARGENPFANDVTERERGTPLTSLAAVREHLASARRPDGRYDAAAVAAASARFRIAGRVLFLRSFGAGAFVRLRDRTGELQLYCQEATLGAAYARLDDLDLGDFVEAYGSLMATDKGELSIDPTELRLLTKAHRPLPTKTTFKDVEQRYRQRYVDLVANPDVAASSAPAPPSSRASASSSTGAASSRSRRRRCTRSSAERSRSRSRRTTTRST
jgi:lysyl-tRNA synthetase class 2